MTTYPTLTPHLAVRDAAAALDFYAQAFGAQELQRFAMPDGTVVHAELLLGDALLTLGEAMPEYQQQAPEVDGPVQVALTWFCADADAAFARAVGAGAIAVAPPSDAFHGDRTATVRCPFGHRWILATHVRDVPHEEQQQAFREMVGL